ncbi:hypothetical protein FO519_000924 [Halicephalobus sp. NKZ332]|nr:hypothetical protein FO519_000924 [Halicephalobus sp. NKZ332]
MSEQEILFEKRGKIHFITFNRPKRKNAIPAAAYERIENILKQANDDPDTVFTVFTGNGDFFSSGNDFGPESFSPSEKSYETMITSLIDHKKILIALVNGPAIGVACTMLTLFDYVVASEKAYFFCPFTLYGLLPEGTSSHNFEAIMGYPRAARLALFADRITAKEAFEASFVTKVLPDSEFATETKKILQHFETQLAPQSILLSKELMRGPEWRKKMHKINMEERDKIQERLGSDETIERIVSRFGPKL